MLRLRAWIWLGLAVVPVPAAAQPAVIPIAHPAANASGWTNSPVRVEFACPGTQSCPEDQIVETEGSGVRVTGSTGDGDGRRVAGEVVLNLDFTAPAVAIDSPLTNEITDSPMLMVVAHASDTVSGLASATCNGYPARIMPAGRIQCVLVLSPGPNDIVLEVSDRADNSGSAGTRVHYRRAPSRLRIVPEIAGVMAGSVRTFQVLDDYGQDAPDVEWRVDNALIAGMADDGSHAFTARGPGVVTLTATSRGLTAAATVTIYAGDRLPADSVRWKFAGLSVVQTPDTQPLTPSDRSLIHASQPSVGTASVESINEVTGRLNWQIRPGVGSGDRVALVREHLLGGALLVVESSTAGSSAIVRSGQFTKGRPWRYRSQGRIDPSLVQYKDGTLSFIETLPSGFPRFVVLKGETGEAVGRLPMPSGVHVALNVSCVEDANVVRLLPPQAGPTTGTPEAVFFPLVIADDFEDFSQCGSVQGRLKRTLYLARIDQGEKRVEPAFTYDVPAGTAAPHLTLFPVSGDGHGAFLVPWTAVYPDTGVRESRVVRLSSDGRQEFTVPTAGKIWLADKDDLALMTDGTRLVVFNVRTGDTQTNRLYPGGVTILSAEKGEVLLAWTNQQGASYLEGVRIGAPK